MAAGRGQEVPSASGVMVKWHGRSAAAVRMAVVVYSVPAPADGGEGSAGRTTTKRQKLPPCYAQSDFRGHSIFSRRIVCVVSVNRHTDCPNRWNDTSAAAVNH